MNYFKYLGLIMGAYIVGAWLWVICFPEKYKALAERWIPEKKPTWFTAVSAAMVLWILFTWIKFSSFQNALSFAITLLLTLSLIKVYFIVFDYKKFREFAQAFVSGPLSVLKTFGLVMIGLGICLIAMGLSF